MGRRENAASKTSYEKGSDSRIPLPAFVISSESEKSFSFAVKKVCGITGNGKHRTPGALEERCFMQTALRRKKEYGKRKRSLGCARDDDTRDRFPHIPFHPAAGANLRPFGMPPPGEGGRVPLLRLPMKKAVMREYRSPHLSFRAKARNLFRSRQDKRCESSGERETPCSLRPERTVLHADDPRRKKGEKPLKQAFR